MSGRIDADVDVAAVLEAPVVKHSQALALLRRAGTDLQLDCRPSRRCAGSLARSSIAPTGRSRPSACHADQ
jgi:hypothetical protein